MLSLSLKKKAYLVEDYLLVAFGLGGDEKGFDDVNILSTSSWSWITQYTANTAWLSGNSTSNGVVRNNTGKLHIAHKRIFFFSKLFVLKVTLLRMIQIQKRMKFLSMKYHQKLVLKRESLQASSVEASSL